MQELAKYRKAIVAFIVGMLQVASVYFMVSSDGLVSPTDVQTIINAVILALGGTAGVYALKNK